jgi:hypothetical protein
MNWFSGNDSTTCQSSIDSTTFEPGVNINGLPMVGGVDPHGNVFGCTANDHMFDSSISTDSFSSFSSESSWCGSTDSFGGGCDWNSF